MVQLHLFTLHINLFLFCIINLLSSLLENSELKSYV